MNNLKDSLYSEFKRYNIPVPKVIQLDNDGQLKLNGGVKIEENCFLKGNIELNQNVFIGCNCHFRGDIMIDRQTYVNNDVEAVGQVRIGKFCAIARRALFQEVNHSTVKPAMQMNFYIDILGSKLEHVSHGPIILGHDVWIGTRVVVLSGVKIGNGAIIGAGSVVTKDIEPYSVNVGIPSQKKKMRFSDYTISQLEKIQWWNWDYNKIKRNRQFFETDISAIRNISDIIVD